MNTSDTALLALLRDALHPSAGPTVVRPPEASTSQECHSERSAAESKNPSPPASDAPCLSPGEWQELLRRAEAHKLLPLILDTACTLRSCRAALRPSAAARGSDRPAPDWRALAFEQINRQVRQENDFLNLFLDLRARGLEPVVVKGPVCRALWPKPLLRPSVDDDLLIPAGSGAVYRAALLDLGMLPQEPEADPERGVECCYYKPQSPLSAEFNTCLFDPDSPAIRDFNEPFIGTLDRAVPVQIQDVTLRTLAPTDHLLYLILHAFKHFLFSGFGLRIVADICLYARAYAEQIDFDRVCAVCASKRCDRFAAAVCRIGEKYLDLPMPEAFRLPETDETALLADILDAGLHGETVDRLRSSSFTVGAVEDRNAGSRSSGLLRALFPSRRTLTPRYPWLEQRPWLLPAAWAGRMGAYVRNHGKYGKESPAATVRIGRERVRLLEEYGVIDR